MAMYNDLVAMCDLSTIVVTAEQPQQRNAARADAVDANEDTCEECGSSFGIFVWRHVCDSCSRIRCDACAPECESSDTRLCSHCLPNAVTAGCTVDAHATIAESYQRYNARLVHYHDTC